MNSPIVEAHTFLWSKIAADNRRNRILVTCPWVEKLAMVDGRSGHIEYVDLGFSAKAVDYGILDVAILPNGFHSSRVELDHSRTPASS